MTFLSVQKMLALLVLPVGLVWVLLLAAAWLCFRRKQWTPALVLLVAGVLYAAAGSVPLGAVLMARLEAEVPRLEVAKVEPFDAVLVLGGGSREGIAGSPGLGLAGDRIHMAAKLWHAGKARLLVASGVNGQGGAGVQDSGADTRLLWLELGIPDAAILVVATPCRITREEIAAYRQLQDQFGWQRVALLSSASHLPRAMGLARKAGLRVTPVGANWRGRSLPFELKRLVPQAEGFLDVQTACWEWLGRWVGR